VSFKNECENFKTFNNIVLKLLLCTFQTFLFFTSLIAFTRASTIVAGPGLAVAAAPSYLVRAPAHDSASIEHHRLGGNFAYSTAEAHAFASVTPQISTLTHPVAETTHTHIPAPIATHQPAPILRTHHVAQPIFQDVPVHATVPVTGPIATHQTVHQPIVHETLTHSVQAVSHVAAAPAYAAYAPAAYAAAPIAAAAPAWGYAAH
jgi:hypothetical protein